MLQLNNNYVGRSDTIKSYSSLILLPSLLLLPQFCSQDCTTILQLIVSNVYMVLKSSWTHTVAEMPYKFGFLRLSIYLECKISELSGFFLIFSMKLDILKHPDRSWFLNKSSDGFKGHKMSPQNEVFRILAKILSTQIYMLFSFNMEVSEVF